MSRSSSVRSTNSSCLSMTAGPCWSATFTCVDGGQHSVSADRACPGQSFAAVLPGRYRPAASLPAAGPGRPAAGPKPAARRRRRGRPNTVKGCPAADRARPGELDRRRPGRERRDRSSSGPAAPRTPGADLVVFPEMMLTGYPVEDLALRASFVDASIADAARRRRSGWARRGWATSPWSPATWTGGPGGTPRVGRTGARAAERGGAAVRRHGRGHHGQASPAELRGVRRVPLFRARQPAAGGPRAGAAAAGTRSTWPSPSARTCGRTAARSRSTRQAGAGLLVVPNASPYERGKDEARLELCVRRAREAGAALAYVNMMGGQDELVFDGDSIIVDADGRPDRPGASVRGGAAGRRPRPARRGRPGQPAAGR